MKILVTGGREYSNKELVYRVLDSVLSNRGISLVIQGGAKGADSLAKEWCLERGVHSCQVDALWQHFGKAAGHRRNATMLKLSPDGCIAFKGGRGTEGMVSMCDKAGIKIWRVGIHE